MYIICAIFAHFLRTGFRCTKTLHNLHIFVAFFLHFCYTHYHSEREISCPKSRVFSNLSAVLSREIWTQARKHQHSYIFLDRISRLKSQQLFPRILNRCGCQYHWTTSIKTVVQTENRGLLQQKSQNVQNGHAWRANQNAAHFRHFSVALLCHL